MVGYVNDTLAMDLSTNSHFDYMCIDTHNTFPEVRICEFKDAVNRKTDLLNYELSEGDLFVFIHIPYTNPLYEESWVMLSMQELHELENNDNSITSEKNHYHLPNHTCDMCNNKITERTYNAISSPEEITLHSSCYSQLLSNLMSAIDKAKPKICATQI